MAVQKRLVGTQHATILSREMFGDLDSAQHHCIFGYRFGGDARIDGFGS
jgi:hypothetical protein